MALIGMCSSCTNRAFQSLGDVGPEPKVSVLGPLPLQRKIWLE
jgi:hypothetical protein